MKTVTVMEHIAKKDRVYPAHHWRIVERKVVERSDGQTKMLKQDWKLIKKDLTFYSGVLELSIARAKVSENSGIKLG